MSRLDCGWSELKKDAIFFPSISTPAWTFFWRTNIEMTNTLASGMHLFKEKEEEQLRGEFTKEKNFTKGERINYKLSRSEMSVLFNQTCWKS